VKRENLIRELEKAGCYLKRHGKKHDIYANPLNGKQSPVPRHSEIKETLIKLIKEQLDI
jgi:mRNA interferase HicA